MSARKHQDPAAQTSGQTALIVRFPGPHTRRNRLATADLRDARHWAAGHAGTWCRIVIYADPDEDDEIGDFISIYRIGHHWAAWGAARRGRRILLWRADTGKDVGRFATMREALDLIVPPAQTMTPHHRSQDAAG